MAAYNAMLLVVTAVLILAGFITGSPQQLNFYEDWNCSGIQSENITESRNDLNSTWIRNAKSLRAVGIWKVFIQHDDPDYSPNVLVRTFLDGTQPPSGNCFNKDEVNFPFPDIEDYFFNSVIRLGSSDMTKSEIVFYDGELFWGSDCVVNRDTVVVGQRPFQAMSYVLLSNDSWAIYPEENYNGRPITIAPNGTGATPEDFISYDWGRKLTIGSAKKINKGEDGGDNDGSKGASPKTRGTQVLVGITFVIIIINLLF